MSSRNIADADYVLNVWIFLVVNVQDNVDIIEACSYLCTFYDIIWQ